MKHSFCPEIRTFEIDSNINGNFQAFFFLHLTKYDTQLMETKTHYLRFDIYSI